MLCRRGDSWQWQGLNFEVLWPGSLTQNSKNDDSCVIRIDDGKHSVLLTGDLENKGEYQVIREHGGKLDSTILQVPHHGSKTSSTPPFLRALKPALALASVARYNSWRLPSKKVRCRYKKIILLGVILQFLDKLACFFSIIIGK